MFFWTILVIEVIAQIILNLQSNYIFVSEVTSKKVNSMWLYSLKQFVLSLLKENYMKRINRIKVEIFHLIYYIIIFEKKKKTTKKSYCKCNITHIIIVNIIKILKLIIFNF